VDGPYLSLGKNSMAKEQWEKAAALAGDEEVKKTIQGKIDKMQVGD